MFNSFRKQNKTHLNRITIHFYIELRKKNVEKIRTFTLLIKLLWRLKVVFHCWKIHRSLLVISDSWNDFRWNFNVCFFFYVFAHKSSEGLAAHAAGSVSWFAAEHCECTSVTHDISRAIIPEFLSRTTWHHCSLHSFLCLFLPCSCC